MRTLTTYPVILLEDALKIEPSFFIDVRSPSEFEKDRLYRASNIPLFSDFQRAIVGTIYTQVSSERARQKGGEITRKRIHWILSELFQKTGRSIPFEEEWFEDTLQSFIHQKGLPSPKLYTPAEVDPSSPPIFIYCWRGGMRSAALAVLLSDLGENIYQIQGGYKAFRQYIFQSLKEIQPPPLVILDGLTGVGKTEILRKIEERLPQRTLDLEGLAQHRSSILGDLGLNPRIQKGFETLLLERLLNLQGPKVFVEGEARKIGNLEIPERLYQTMEEGEWVLISAPIKVRAERLMREYVREETLDFLAEKMDFFQRHFSPKKFHELSEAFHQKDFERITILFMEEYYDPLYNHAMRKKPHSITVDATDLDRAVDELTERFG